MIIFIYLIDLLIITYASLVAPIAHLDNTIITSVSSYGNLSKIKANQDFILRLSTTGKYNVWSSNSYQVANGFQDLLNSFLSMLGMITTPGYIDLSLTQNDYVGIITKTQLTIKNLLNTSNQVNKTFPSGYTGQQVQLLDHVVYILSDQRMIIRMNRFNLSQIVYFNVSNIFNEVILRFTACEKENGIEYVTIWNGYDKIFILECNNVSCQIIRNFSGGNSLAWNVDQILFSKTCKYILIEKDQTDFIRVWNVFDDSLHVQLFQPAQTIYRVQFYDSYEEYVTVFCQNNSMLIYSINSTDTNKFKGSIGINQTLSSQMDFVVSNRKLFIGISAQITGHIFNCTSPSLFNSRNLCYYCATCGSNQTCNAVIGGCQDITQNTTTTNTATTNTTMNNTANNLNITNNTNTPQNQSNTTQANTNQSNMTQSNTTQTNTTQNQTNTIQYQNQSSNFPNNQPSTIENTANNSSAQQPLTQIGQSVQSLLSGQVVGQAVQGMQTTTSATIMFLQITPFAILFVGFINFWTICSLYALIQTQVPTFLKSIIQQVYSAVNYSIFDSLGVKLDATFGLQDKFVNTFYNSYGINSVFLQMHMQDLSKFIVCIVFLLLIYGVKNLFSKNSWFYKKLKLNNSFIIASQFISVSVAFILPFNTVSTYSEASYFGDKINTSLHLVIVAITLILPFIALAPDSIKTSHKRHQSGKDQEQQQLLLQRKDIFTTGLYTSYFAFSIITQNLFFILLAGIVINLHGIRVANQLKQFRKNKIILSLHTFMFHISFFIMVFFNQYMNFPIVYQALGLVCLVFLMIGAVHEVLNLIFEICYGIYKMVKSKHKIQNSNSQTAINCTQTKFVRKTFQDILSTQPPLTQYKTGQLSTKWEQVVKVKRTLLMKGGKILAINKMGKVNEDISKQKTAPYFNQSNRMVKIREVSQQNIQVENVKSRVERYKQMNQKRKKARFQSKPNYLTLQYNPT